MKSLILIYLLGAVIAHCAEQVSSIMTVDGKHVDSKKVEEFIAWAEPSIREYPPHFKDADQEKRINLSTLLVTNEITKLDPKKIKDAVLLTNLGHILAMGNNLDLPGGEQAKVFFERALSLDPKSRRANYLFGMYLISTSKFHMESLPYLQKAYVLGEKDAQYSVGLLLCEKGDKTNGLKELESYSLANPNNESVKQVIKATKDGTLEIKRTNND